MHKAYLLLLFLALFMQGCSNTNPLFTSSKTLPAYKQTSFKAYIDENKAWLQENRVFLSNDINKELRLNTPFELRPEGSQKPKKGILLVHGLGDSPGYFQDIAKELSKEGFLVRAVLLTGHGSRPADLISVKFKAWQELVSHHVKLLQQEVGEVWLGGFSTGTNLVTSYALSHERDVSGLLLYSPGFVSDEESLLTWAGLAKVFKTWVFQNENSNNILRYESLAMNGASLYYQSLLDVRKKLQTKTFNKPVFITISEDDSVIEADKIPAIFSKNFPHPSSRLLWYGKPYKSSDSRIISLPSYLPQERIGNFSHLSVLFNENSSFYGKNSTFKMLRNGQEKTFDANKHELWFSAWGLQKEGIYFARLTWNPYFNESVEIMKKVLTTK